MPDPADGEGRRDDDIDQREPPAPAATPAGRPSRARRWVWATLAVVAGLAVAGVVTVVWLVERSTPSAGEYGDAVDALALPPEFTLISETEYGNALCLDECLRLDRRYSSPSSLDDTFQIVYDALRAAGYQCESPCRYFGVAGGILLTNWIRSDGPRISVSVFSTADRGEDTYIGSTLVDPTRQVHVDIRVG